MQEKTRELRELEGRRARKKSDSIPKRRVFMMGNGRPVQPSRAEAFCSGIVNGCLDGEVREHYEFVLGFAACFDAVARGTIDLEADPVRVAMQARSDVNNITPRPNSVTNIMKDIS